MIGIRLWQVAGWTMLHYFWVGTALGVVALLVRRCLRSAPANVRYLFALGTLLLLSGAPVPIAVVVMQNMAPLPQEAPLPVELPADMATRSDMARFEEMRPTMAAIPASAPVADVNSPVKISETPISERFLAAVHWAVMCLPWFWIFGAPLTFALTTAGLLGAERLRRQSRPLEDARISETCRQLAESLRISYRVSVGICDRIAAPILVGILRPMILLPAAALAGWDPQQLEMVLLHELAHVRRYDNLVNLLQRIVESLLFFHPMVWIASGWVRREREHCCDELVVARTRQPHVYADILVTMAERLSQGTLQSSSFVHPQVFSSMAERPLIARVRRILKKEEQTMQVSRRSVGLILVAAIALAVFSGWYCARVSLATDDVAAQSGEMSKTDPEKILQTLRANDDRFDNLELKYLKTETCEIKLSRFRYDSMGGADGSKMPKDYWEPRTVKWARSCNLVLRGKNVTLTSRFEPTLSDKDKYATPVAFFEEGVVDGKRYEIHDSQLAAGDPSKTVPNSEKQYRVTKASSMWDSELRMPVEFPFGIGFGKRIKRIDSVNVKDGVRIITGRIQIWTEDVSRFEIELDENGLVRKAAIHCDVRGHHTEFESTSTGTVRQGELLLAKAGTFRRQPSSDRSESRVEFKGLAANLSDEQYAKLAEFKIEPLMQVDDEVSGVHGTGAKREDGSVYIEERGKRKGNSAKAMEAKPKPAAPKSSDQPNKPPASKPSDGKSTAKNLTYTGQVTDKLTSKAIAGAIVAVRRQIVAPYEQRILDESTHTTDAAGKYTFTIPPEQVVQGHLFIEVEVSHPSYMMRKDGYGFSMIHRNEQLGQRPFFEHIELNPAEQVSGTVVTPDGKPAAGIKVIGFTMPDRHDIDSHSFPETITDANGGFRLNLAKGCPAVFWLLPKGHALATHVIGTRRGDMGRMTLGTGAVVKGRVVDEEGKPVHGVWVNAAMIDGPGREILVQLADPLERSALTDEEGEFTLAPLPAGECLVVVSERPGDRLQDRQALRPLSNVFRHTRLKLNGESTVPLEIRAVPQVVVEGQYRDRFGKPRSGHQPYLLGEIDDKTLGDQHGYVAYGVIDEGGHFVVRAPNGLKNARLHLSTTEHCSLRVRMTKDGPLINPRSEIDLGTLEHDIRGIEAIRYNAPVVLAKGVDEDGKTIKGFQVELKYVRESMQMHGPRFLREDGKPAGDVSFSRQDDGRLRSEQLLPDEEFTLTVEAEGYEPKSEKLELPEGATKELEVKLKERV